MIPDIEKEEYQRLTQRWKTPQGIDIIEKFWQTVESGQIWQSTIRDIEDSIEVDAQLDLRGFDFSNRELSNIDFSGATLHYASFENSKLTGCDFSNSVMFYADFKNATLKECSFSNSLMSRLYAPKAIFDSCSLEDTNLLGSDLTGTTFQKCQMKNSFIFMAKTEGISFTDTDQSQIRLTGATPFFD